MDGPVGGDDRDDEAGHGMTHEHRFGVWIEPELDGPRMVRGSQARVGDWEFHGDDAVAQALELRPEVLPAPGAAIGPMDQGEIQPTPLFEEHFAALWQVQDSGVL